MSSFRKVELWKEVSEGEWEDWRWQLSNRITTLEQLKKIIQITPEEEGGVKLAKGRLSLAITPYWAHLMDPEKPYCPIRRQAVPQVQETVVVETELADPCAEDSHTPVPGLVHRYPDRVLLLATERCATYCRHCTRRRMVGEENRDFRPDLSRVYEYIRANKKIRDVLVSGGDPLMLEDGELEEILKNLRAINHVEIVRIGTRMPVTLPQRITEELVAMLKKYHPLWMSIHFNHAKEITRRVRRACEMLAGAGIPLGSQTVLLKEINDRPYIMKKLMQELLTIRVRPYYLYQCDLVRGTSHFRTPLSVGLNIIEKLTGHTSGYAVPTFVVDAPAGGGKIPFSPNCLVSQNEGAFVFRNFEGKEFVYREEVCPSEATLPRM